MSVNVNEMVYASGDSLVNIDGSEIRTIYSVNRVALAETVNKSSEVTRLRESYEQELANFESKKRQIIEHMWIDGYMGSEKSAADLVRLRVIKSGVAILEKNIEKALSKRKMFADVFADELLSILNDTAGSQNA
jgi:hypothetical protein